MVITHNFAGGKVNGVDFYRDGTEWAAVSPLTPDQDACFQLHMLAGSSSRFKTAWIGFRVQG